MPARERLDITRLRRQWNVGESAAIEQALAKLAAIDKRQALEVELKIFSGLTSEEIAELLPVSDATIERD